MNESDVKSKIVKAIKDNHQGYARRFEDQYAVGIPDMVIIPVGGYGTTWFIEAKVRDKKGGKWGPTPRQEVELRRIMESGGYAATMCYCKEDNTLDIVNFNTGKSVTLKWDPKSVAQALRTIEHG